MSDGARERVRAADSYLIHYGSWDRAAVELARAHDLVILDPNEVTVDRELVRAVQHGYASGERRIPVVGYLSVGEDLRTAGRPIEELAGDPGFVGDGTGPRVDPRGVRVSGAPLTGLDRLGASAPGGTGWASWYLDDVSRWNDPRGVGDGLPDRNPQFETLFVNAGDPAWFELLEQMTVADDGVAGAREILTGDHGRGLACDGLFLDTFDTASPNAWTGPRSPIETKFEWTGAGFGDFCRRARARYPDAVLIQNRGLFFFDPSNPHYRFDAGDAVDAVMFESYRLHAAADNNPDPYTSRNNRFNLAPKLMVVANRPGGFRVLSLGYAVDRPGAMSSQSLIGASTLGRESLLEDLRVAERAGFRHYLTTPAVDLINRFVADHVDHRDPEPPRWTSTYNPHDSGFPEPPGEPAPRVGIQQVVPGPASLTVQWDVAMALNPVGYALYLFTEPPDFAGDPALSQAIRTVLPHDRPAAYTNGSGEDVYPHQARLLDLRPGQTYYLVIRAFDRWRPTNEERNQIVLTGVPLPAQSSS